MNDRRSAAPFRVIRYESVASTNDLAREAALAGEGEGLWIVAREQTAGRGRHGRSWASPPGNFYGSLILRPQKSLAVAASLSLVAALAVGETLLHLSGGQLQPRLKWPNDVLLGGAKIAGLLLEGDARAGGLAAFVVMGLGVNLAFHPPNMPYPVTSLAEQGFDTVGPESFLEALVPRLAACLDIWREGGFARLRDPWLAMAFGQGESVAIRTGAHERRGRFVDVDNDGALRLVTEDGQLQRFDAGEIFFS